MFGRFAGRCVVRGAGHRLRGGRGRHRRRGSGLRRRGRRGRWRGGKALGDHGGWRWWRGPRRCGWRRRGGLRRRRGWWRCGGGGGGRRCGSRRGGGCRGRLRGTGRRRRWRAVVAAVVAPAVAVVATVPVSVPVSVSVCRTVSVVVPVAVPVMSATPAGEGPAAVGGRGHPGGCRAVPRVDRRVGAAIGHRRRGGHRRPHQDRYRQQAPGTCSVHPGSMGPRAPAHATVGTGSPERAEFGP